jgi:hypothetical protein
MCENTSNEVADLKTRIAELEALLASTEHTLRYERESARTVESQYLDLKTTLNRACEIFERIIDRDEIKVADDSLYEDLGNLLGYDPMVEVWITVQAQWSQKVSLPRGYDDSKVEIETSIPDRLTVSYDRDELDDELTEDEVKVEVSE